MSADGVHDREALRALAQAEAELLGQHGPEHRYTPGVLRRLARVLRGTHPTLALELSDAAHVLLREVK